MPFRTSAAFCSFSPVRRRVLVTGVLVGTVVASGGVVVGLSAASSGKIADGVRVGSIELGGLTAEQAKARLRA